MDEYFKELGSKWVTKFVDDIALKPEVVLKKVDSFPGNQELLRKVIKEGPAEVDQKDPDIANEIFNFIEFYNTGRVSGTIEVKVNE